MTINNRLQYIRDTRNKSASERKRESMRDNLCRFLYQLPWSPTLSNVTPDDLCRFLIWKDNNGKTKVHFVECPAMGKSRVNCFCPTRLSADTVDNYCHQLREIFKVEGRGETWSTQKHGGNPACAPQIKSYVKCVKEEQAKAHVVRKQAKPLFISKLRVICLYIDRELQRTDLTVQERYIFLRDQACLKMQFFAGDRAGDLGMTKSQEIYRLTDNSGFVVMHTFGKTLRGGKYNTFIMKRCPDLSICPVLGLDRYISETNDMGCNLKLGYLFRPTAENGLILSESLSYAAIYSRLKGYLSTLGIDEGETPHSLRGGCALTMFAAGTKSEGMMQHVGWHTKESVDLYTRGNVLNDGGVISKRLAESTDNKAEHLFKEFGDLGGLKSAFI